MTVILAPYVNGRRGDHILLQVYEISVCVTIDILERWLSACCTQLSDVRFVWSVEWQHHLTYYDGGDDYRRRKVNRDDGNADSDQKNTNTPIVNSQY